MIPIICLLSSFRRKFLLNITIAFLSGYRIAALDNADCSAGHDDGEKVARLVYGTRLSWRVASRSWRRAAAWDVRRASRLSHTAASVEFAPNDDPAGRESDLLPDLAQGVPTRLQKGGGYVLGADVTFGEGFLHVTGALPFSEADIIVHLSKTIEQCISERIKQAFHAVRSLKCRRGTMRTCKYFLQAADQKRFYPGQFSVMNW